MKTWAYRMLLAFTLVFAVAGSAWAETPDVGAKVPGFTLSTPEGKAVALSSVLGKGDVVLVILRGYPGYQCPFCMKQVHDLEENAGKFAAKGMQLLLVYPGNATELDAKATEFTGKTGPLPANFVLVTDPDFKVTNLLGLRWDAPKETAYPTTFILDKSGKVLWRKISRVHGDRASTEDILAADAAAKR